LTPVSHNSETVLIFKKEKEKKKDYQGIIVFKEGK